MWAGLAQRQWPELELMYAIPNGARTSITVAKRLKAEGLRKGMLDVHLPVARRGYIGLWIEMKVKGNKLTPEQERKADLLRLNGHLVVTCYSGGEAIDAVRGYLDVSTEKFWTAEGA